MSRHNTKRRQTKSLSKRKQEQATYQVGSDVFTGISFFDTLEDNVNVDQRQNCSPDMNFYESNKKVIINYSNCQNQRDIRKIRVIF